MATQHKNITEADLHEMKGASTATIYQVPVADGAGSTAFGKLPTQGLSGISSNGTAGQAVKVDGAGGFVVEFNDHGSVTFVNTATPFAMTGATTSFTKCAPTTTASGSPINFTEATTARLTYTGGDSEDFVVHAVLSVDQASGAGKDVSIAVALNGTVITNTEQLATTTSGSKAQLTTVAQVTMTTNDYVEVFVKISAAATVNVYAFNLMAVLA